MTQVTMLTEKRTLQRLLAVLLTLSMLAYLAPFSAQAEVAPPASLAAPEHFGVVFNTSDFKLYINASDSVRAYLDQRIKDAPNNPDLENFTLYFQVDARINNGGWQYTSDWDSPKTVPDSQRNRYYIPCKVGEYYAGSSYAYMEHLFSDEELVKTIKEAGWEYFNSNSITFRARFAQSFDNGKTYVLSPWSKEFVLSANTKLDAQKMINHAPVLKGAEIVMRGDTPYLAVKVEKVPRDVGELNVATGGNVRAEVWMRKQGDKDFKQVHYWWVSHESILFNVEQYFEERKDSYEAAAYEIKIRYGLDLRTYKQAGVNSSTSVDIYSPFSNVISHNMPAWGNASAWATNELKMAEEAGLIPEILKGADMTKPITREEFCELALLLYEMTTGKSPEPAYPNPFTDTKNPQVLKAYALGITQGTSATTFSPQVLINREQCATMLFRAIKAIHLEGDYSTAGVPDFPDQKDISAFAVEGAKFMSKLGIIKGDSKGNFMPKATTSAQTAAGYGMATREATVLMSVRTYNQMDTIKESSVK